MSQHDFDVANASGLAVRSDLNLALKALASLSAGAVDPSATVGSGGVGITYAYQLWVDTSGSSPILKIRNAANSGWITLGPVDAAAFGFNTLQVGTSVTSPLAYQFWVDTSSTPVLKMRNGANSAWITIGDPAAAYLGLLPLTGGTLTGALSSSNTDHWKIPVGTTGQRSGSPANGMIRFNSTLGVYEGYKSGAWSSLGSAGGGGSLQWVESDNAPSPTIDSMGNRTFSFEAGLAQTLYTAIKVPKSYTAGSPIKLLVPFYHPDASGTCLFQTVATLIRPGTSAYNSTTNQRTSTNSAVSLGAGTQNIPQMVEFDISSSSGQINGQAIAADDIIYIALSRGTDTATSNAELLAYIAELTFGS